MNRLTRIRETLGLGQEEVARRAGITPQRLSDYESGRRRCPSGLWKDLCKAVGVELPEVRVFGERDYRSLTRGRKWEVVLEEGPTWFTTPARRGEHHFGSPKNLPDPSFQKLVRTDSGLESATWEQCCEAGFRPALVSPVRMGFEHYPLVDGQGRALGIGPCPALHLQREDAHIFVWPQRWMLGPLGRFRPDALILYARPRQQRWLLLEIDGPDHTASKDALRDARLETRVVRLQASVILQRKAVAVLLKELTVD